MSAFNYFASLYNRVLKEDPEFPVGRGPIQSIQRVDDEENGLKGETCYHGDRETHRFKVLSHWLTTNSFQFKTIQPENGHVSGAR